MKPQTRTTPTENELDMARERMSDGETRQAKHVEINSALNELDIELRKMRDFISCLSEGPVPAGEGPNVQEPEPSFLNVYNNIAGRIFAASRDLTEMTQQLKDMLI